MGLDKFLNDDFDKIIEKENLRIPEDNYKERVDYEVKKTFNSHDFNLMNIEKNDIEKKVPMSVYFKKDDLDLLKAIAYNKNTTVNKILQNILDEPLRVTRDNLPKDFSIKKLANKYENKCRKRKTF